MENYKLGNLICYFKALLTFVPSISDIKKTNIKERGVKPMTACWLLTTYAEPKTQNTGG